MALVLADRVKETTTTTGTGTVTLLGASTGFQSFAVVGNTNTTYYTIAAQTGTEWEVGIGTYTLSGTTLARTTVLSSSNSGSPVNFSAGTKDVFVTYPSSRSVYANGTVLTATNSSILPVTSGGTGVTTSTGTTNVVLSNSPTLVTPALGTPSALVGTNITGTATAFTASNVTTNANLTGDITSVGNATTLTNAPVIAKVLTGYVSGAGTVAATDSILQAIQKLNGNDATNANLTGAVTSVGNATSLGSFTSAQLLGALTDETGTGAAVFATSPTLVTPALGTPSALVGTNITGTATAFTASNVTTNANLTGAVTSVGNAASLGSFTSLQLLTALTDETGTGANVFATSPTLVTPILGTPASGTVTNLTGTASININGTVGATTATTGAFTSLTASTTLGVTGVSTFAAGTAALPGLTTTGDTNTGIFFPAADTIGLTTSGTERMRIDSAGSVGIGAVPTSAAKANITSNSAGASTIALSLQNAATNTIGSETVLDLVPNANGAGVRSAQISAINTNGTTGVNMLFKIGNGAVPTEAMRITSLGGLQIQTGVGVGAATPGASGVAFPATAIAVADANTLDDYEEGSWTPVVTFTGGNGDLTTAVALGVYTKIGRLVQIAFNVEFSETTALTNLTITGVPFTSGSTVTVNVGCFVDNMTTIVGSPVIQLGTSTTTINLRQTQTGSEAAITNLNTATSSRVRGSLSYSI